MVLSITQFLDDLYTTTWQNRQEGVADNVFNATPFWFWLKEKGRLFPTTGGRVIEENLEFAANGNVQWVTRGGTVPLTDFTFLTVAQYQWRYLTASIVRFAVDDQQNAGKAQILNWVQQKLDNTEAALGTELEARLAGGFGTSVNALDGLQHLVPNDPTAAGNFGGAPGATAGAGGIDSSQTANAWWRNQRTNMNNSSFAVNGVNNMRTMLDNCMNNRAMDAPDIIVSDQTTFEFYEDNVLPFLRITNNKLADVGFMNQTFKGIPMVWSPSLTQILYMLNTRFLKFIYDPRMFFEMTEWKPIPDQVEDRAAQIITACQLTTNRRRVHGVLFNINTA